ncbi:His-Xaa-Ser system radical SAM maturase HxsB [Vitreimonas sp.]|uniref:His-Xaa-Ser system radical SAM maturase HxsB n=1 Tax=Vitreimonas sp. TaxID=3069702 RepID=UPI002ED88D0C
MRRSRALPAAGGVCVLTNDLGEFALVDDETRLALEIGSLTREHPRFFDLQARGLHTSTGPIGGLADVVKRTRKAFLLEGPALHIFVITLRCDHACQYCQVSRAPLDATGRDMSEVNAIEALNRVFESDAPALTIEFQGGEPSLRFDLVRQIVEAAQGHPERHERAIRFTMATTLHRLTNEDLHFCKDHGIHLSTSIDGPDEIHTTQRALPTKDSWRRTVDALARAREVLGEDGIVALPTITKAMLNAPEALIDTYVALGFRSIFLRPLAPYGFAQKTQRRLGYSTEEFARFYDRALSYILALNERGVEIEETTAAIALRHMLTPFHSGYVDLRSPAGAGLGVLVYNYDGRVYPTDEARMAAETGDGRFCLGDVRDSLDTLLSSPAMHWLARGAIAEEHPDCRQCAFVPYCGADPVFHAIAQGEPDAPRIGTSFCERNLTLFDTLFSMIAARQPAEMRTLHAWALGASPNAIKPGWIER